jgi:hypothetical protein
MKQTVIRLYTPASLLNFICSIFTLLFRVESIIMTCLTNFLYSQLLVTIPYPTKDFTGKTAQTIIVAGANTGLGFEAAKYFIHLHASKVILAAPSLENSRFAKESILGAYRSTPETAIEVWYLDLSSYDSVTAFGERVKSMERFDAVLENAGIGTVFGTRRKGMKVRLL